MPRSVTARVMIVCICPRKKRTRSGFTALGCSSISASAAFNCEQMSRCLLGDRPVSPSSRCLRTLQCTIYEHIEPPRQNVSRIAGHTELSLVCAVAVKEGTKQQPHCKQVCIQQSAANPLHLCAVDFVVWEVPRVLKATRLVADEQLPDLLPALVQDGSRAKIQLPCVSRRRSARGRCCLCLSGFCRHPFTSRCSLQFLTRLEPKRRPQSQP